MIALSAERVPLAKAKADVIAVLVVENAETDAEAFRRQRTGLERIFESVKPGLNAEVFAGRFQETLTLFPTETNAKLLLVGLGRSEKLTMERLRRVAATAAKTAVGMKAKTLAIASPDARMLSNTTFADDSEAIGAALAEGAVLSVYKFGKYITDAEKRNTSLRRVHIVCSDGASLAALQRGTERARVVCEATYLARDLANAPPNEIYPATLAQRAKATGRRFGFSVKVLDEQGIRKAKMGGVLAVAKGSEQPPRFIIMEYRPRRRRRTRIVLVGKGVTFDAGGISIKPAGGMSEMKMDMAGAAAVIAAMSVAAPWKLPHHIIGLVPAVENLLGGAAMKPGDVITHLNGKTSEVDNTDAEGRLILADALAFAARYEPDVVIDLATLTGHVVVGLGHHATGMMGNDQEVMDALREAGERTYERVWQLPMFEEYEKQIKSDIADVKNSGGRPAGAITAALFLKRFIGRYRWVHLDIAGTAILNESLDYIPKGASGVGVRLLAEFLRTWEHSEHFRS